MPDFPERISQFWKELKDRKVLRSTTVYVAVVFGLLEMIDITSGPLQLPGWVLKICILLFIIGFPITIVISWIFSFTSEGIRPYKKPDWKSISETSKNGTLRATPDPGTLDTDKLISIEDKLEEDMESKRSRAHTGRIYGISSLVLISIVAVTFLFYGGMTTTFNERDWIVLADFVNHTEEEIFDHSLNTAFEISINQSRHVNVVTRSRVQEVLKRIGKESETKINEELCREIASREGASVYILPEISKVGNHYILSAELMDSENNNVLISEIFYTKSKDEILNKLDLMSKKMRRHLGESRYKIAGQNKALEQVTTSSLEALKQYSLGMEAHRRIDLNNAVKYYENAIRLDSNFTAAKASLGNILYEHFDSEKGKIWLDNAIKSIDKLTVSERLSILAFYAANVEMDMDKSIELTRMHIEIYPDITKLRNNLAWYLQNRGDYREAIIEYSEAIRLDPYFMIPYAGIIGTYMRKLGQLDSSIVWSNKMISVAPENGWGHFYLGSGYFGLDNFEKAVKEFEKAMALAPGVPIMMYRLAHTYRVLGEYDKAVEVLNEIIGKKIQHTPAVYNLGIIYEMMGMDDKAKETYLNYKSFTDNWEINFPDNPNTYLSKGSVLTKLGKKEVGLKAGMKGFDMDTSNHFNIARFLAVQNRKAEAIDHLELALELGYREIVWIKMDPDMALLWDEPRYQQLLKDYFN